MEKKFLHDDGGNINQEKREQYGGSSKARKLMYYVILLPHFYVCMYVKKGNEINITKGISLTAMFIIARFIVAKI